MTDILIVLHKIGYTDLKESGETWRTRPLYRDSDNPTVLCIKKTTGQWFDHAERTGGSLAQLVQRTLNLPSLGDVKTYMGDLPVYADTREAVELTDTKRFEKHLLQKLSKDNTYWNQRGVSDATLEKFRGGLAVTNGRLRGRYVFPIFDDKDEIIGFSGRLTFQSGTMPKWKHLGQKKNFIFPIQSTEHIMSSKTAIIIESIGDCLKMIECGINNTIVSFGVSLSPKIIQHLLKLDVGRIIIALNNDEDNGFVGNEASEEYKEELKKYFDEDKITIALPTAKDFGEMSCEDIQKWKEKHLNEN